MKKARISPAMGSRLLRFYLTGDPGGGSFSTMQALEKAGMIVLGRKIEITEAGRAWCDQNHGRVKV